MTTVEQQKQMREIVGWLDEDLFEPGECDPDVNSETSAQWRSPLGWSVILTPRKDGKGISGAIRNPNGETISQTSYVDILWLDEKIP
jgi:hypothetical protein